MSIGLMLASLFTMVELNCENLFDCRHDSLKNDTEWTPQGDCHWTRTRYWQKLDNVSRTIIACGELPTGLCADGEKAHSSTPQWRLPDLVALCEVENDSVMTDLTRRSLLRNAGYEYVMTDSPDPRGVDVALLYSPATFKPLCRRDIRVSVKGNMKPTRDILYVAGQLVGGDTLHVVVCHLPSRRGGEKPTRPHRRRVTEYLCALVDSIKLASPEAMIIMAGDFNDYAGAQSLSMLSGRGMADVSDGARGINGAKGTYRYQGEWGSLDHILVSRSLTASLLNCYINDREFLVEDDTRYGGKKPRRNYLGPKWLGGFSDHLPLVAVFEL